MKKKLIIAFAVFTAIGAAIFFLLTTGNIGAKYNTAEVTRGEVGQSLEEVGRVSSRNIRRYYGTGTARVEEMPLRLGDPVLKGQLLVKYEDTLDLEIQRVEKQIDALRATYREALSGTDAERLNSARIEVAGIRASLELAEKNRDRMEELFHEGAVSLIELEQAVNQVRQLQDSLGIAQNTYNQLARGLSADARVGYEAQIDGLLITLDIYRQNREKSMVYADVDGIVTELHTFEGDMPSPGALILEIQDPTERVILVDFMVEEARIVRPGMAVDILDLTLGLEIGGLTVDRIHPKAFVTLSELGVNENRQTVEISLPATAEALPYGLEVKTRVSIEESRDALLIPRGAVILKNGTTVVEVLEGRAPVERQIITGMETPDRIEVISGLSEGELVVLKYQVN